MELVPPNSKKNDQVHWFRPKHQEWLSFTKVFKSFILKTLRKRKILTIFFPLSLKPKNCKSLHNSFSQAQNAVDESTELLQKKYTKFILRAAAHGVPAKTTRRVLESSLPDHGVALY